MIRTALVSLGLIAAISTGASAQMVAKKPTTATVAPASQSRVPSRVARTPHAAQSQAPRTAKSLACSAQADAKGLHGKPRKAFMSTCKHAQ